MERKINVPIYILAFVITIVIFGIGFWIGSIYDSILSETIETRISDVSYQALSLQLIYLMGEDSSYCEFYTAELEKIDRETELVGYELSLLEEAKGYTNPELKDKYFLLETTSFTIHRRIGEICGTKDKEILYFYSNEKCGEDCVIQGRELLKLKENKNVRIYSFDCTINSPIANSLCNKYNVKSYPTIVTNEKILVGLHRYNELLNNI